MLQQRWNSAWWQYPFRHHQRRYQLPLQNTSFPDLGCIICGLGLYKKLSSDYKKRAFFSNCYFYNVMHSPCLPFYNLPRAPPSHTGFFYLLPLFPLGNLALFCSNVLGRVNSSRTTASSLALPLCRLCAGGSCSSTSASMSASLKVVVVQVVVIVLVDLRVELLFRLLAYLSLRHVAVFGADCYTC